MVTRHGVLLLHTSLALHWGYAQDPQMPARGSTLHVWLTYKDQCLPPNRTSEAPG